MAYLFSPEHTIKASDSPSIDGFGRWRTSEPVTLFDSKQLYDKSPLFWDEDIVNSGSTTSTHSVADAATTMTVGAASGDRVIRQTKMRFNYQPGKSQQILQTFVLGAATTNVTKRVGYFNTSTASPYTADIDGIYLEQDGTTQYIVQAKNGTPTSIAQASWNLDNFDGSGPSGITIDWTKAQIMMIDFEWLGVGRVRVGFVINGIIYYAHEFNNANSLSSVYMSSSNHSLRCEIRSTGGTDSFVHICSSVSSEGGQTNLGVVRHMSSEGTHIDANTENTLYAIIGMRLKTTHLSTTVSILNASLQIQTDSDYGEWALILNPTVAGSLTYNGVANSSVEIADGTATNTVTGGTHIYGGYIQSGKGEGGNVNSIINNVLRIASNIDGTRDELILCFRPVGGAINVDVEGSLIWQELI